MKKLEYKGSRTSTQNSRKSRSNNYSGRSTKASKKGKKKNLKVVIILLLVGIVISGTILLCTLPVFNVESVEISGTNRYTADEVKELARIDTGKNIFVLLLKGVSRNVTSLPYVKSAILKINLPNKIQIDITEREPKFFAFNSEKNTYYKIDETGVILEEAEINDKGDLLYTQGFIFDDEVEFGTKLKDIDLSKIDVYNNIVKAYEKYQINGKITRLNFENSLTTITLNKYSIFK